MRSFQHLAPPLRLFHGPDSLAMLPRELARLGCRRALIVCGASLAREGSPLGLVRSVLADLCVGVFSGVRGHSPLPAVDEAVKMLAQTQADAVVAVGGGSAIVTARAAGILLAEARDIRGLCTLQSADGKLVSPKLMAPKLPQFVVPTTPTTACVKAGSAVFDPASGERLALYDPKMRAQALFMHPELLRSAPAALVRTAGLNALAMAVEGLESESGDPVSDALLMHALRLLAQALPASDDDSTRSDMAMAALLCGQGTDFAGGGMASVLGHAIGARFGVENGLANAILLPHTMRFNVLMTAARLHKIAAALGRDGPDDAAPEQALASVTQLLARLHLPARLRDAGVPAEALGDIAHHAMNDWFLRSNPRPVADARELLQVLEAAW